MKDEVRTIKSALRRLKPERRKRIMQQVSEWTTAAAALEEVKSSGRIVIGFMGSAREHEETEEVSEVVERVASCLGPRFAVITGGGDAVMKSANRGAKKSGALSIGLNLLAPNTPEQRPNDFLDLILPHSGFGHRLDNFLTYVDIMVMAIGGFGTDLEEAFYRQCIQVSTHQEIPLIYLRPKSFWRGKFDLIRLQLERRLISPGDLRMVHVVAEDNAEPDDIDHRLINIASEGESEIERLTNLIMRLASEVRI